MWSRQEQWCKREACWLGLQKPTADLFLTTPASDVTSQNKMPDTTSPWCEPTHTEIVSSKTCGLWGGLGSLHLCLGILGVLWGFVVQCCPWNYSPSCVHWKPKVLSWVFTTQIDLEVLLSVVTNRQSSFLYQLQNLTKSLWTSVTPHGAAQWIPPIRF